MNSALFDGLKHYYYYYQKLRDIIVCLVLIFANETVLSMMMVNLLYFRYC